MNWHFKTRWVFGTLCTVLLFLAGFQLAKIQYQQDNPQHISNLLPEQGVVVGEVLEMPAQKEKTIKVVLDVSAMHDENSWLPAEGKVILYLESDGRSAALELGDRLLVKPAFQNVTPPQNPAEFDYQKYLAFRLIYQQAFLKSDEWKRLDKLQGFVLTEKAAKIRKHLLDLLATSDMNEEELGVASALILGYKDKLDAELKRSYSAAGAMHVLAVSGLHVGIVFLVFSQLLKFLDRSRKTKYLKALLLIGLLWTYALLTGMSPSVMRAATMFSFIVMGQSLQRQPNVYNSIASSAFLLLIFDPFLVMDVGFQLSYLAVIGIVYMQPRIYKTIYTRFWILDKLWALTAVSIAAQIATFPVAIFYFHQFPNYFLISNILVIPMATVILYLGLLFFITSPLPEVAAFVGKILQAVVQFLNEGVRWIESLPYSITNGISVSFTECLLMYLAIIFTLTFLHKSKPRYLHVALGIYIVLVGFEFSETILQRDQRKFIVYNIRKTAAYNFVDGHDNFFLCNLPKEDTKRQLQFHVQNNWFKLGLEQEKYLQINKFGKGFDPLENNGSGNSNLFVKQHFVQFYDQRIFIVDKDFELEEPDHPTEVDYIIITNSAEVSLQQLAKCFIFKQLIVDSSNANFKVEAWLAEAAELNLPIYVVAREGALVIDL